MKKIRVFTDGACKGNPGKGGWGAVLRYGEHVKEICGGEPATTNNRMELMGAIKALESLKEPCEVDIFTDSQYLRKGITEWIFAWQKNGWKTSARKPVKNADLWQTIWKLVSFHKVNWHWVKRMPATQKMNVQMNWPTKAFRRLDRLIKPVIGKGRIEEYASSSTGY